jgi:hypothetical protein
LSGLMTTTQQKRACLGQVLRINPDNAYARAGLVRLRRAPQDQTEASEARPAVPDSASPPGSPGPALPKPEIQPLEPRQERSQLPSGSNSLRESQLNQRIQLTIPLLPPTIRTLRILRSPKKYPVQSVTDRSRQPREAAPSVILNSDLLRNCSGEGLRRLPRFLRKHASGGAEAVRASECWQGRLIPVTNPTNRLENRMLGAHCAERSDIGLRARL